MTMHSTWDDARKMGLDEGLAKGRNEGRSEGRSEGLAKALITTLRFRGIPITKAAEKRILTQKDPDVLGRWFEKALGATSLREIFDPAG